MSSSRCFSHAFAVGLAGLVAAIALPSMNESRRVQNEGSALRAIHFIGIAESLFRNGSERHVTVGRYGTLDELRGFRLDQESCLLPKEGMSRACGE